eukprot:scaffold15362_cov72-Phaeocystis_antarctica.AAC.10
MKRTRQADSVHSGPSSISTCTASRRACAPTTARSRSSAALRSFRRGSGTRRRGSGPIGCGIGRQEYVRSLHARTSSRLRQEGCLQGCRQGWRRHASLASQASRGRASSPHVFVDYPP